MNWSSNFTQLQMEMEMYITAYIDQLLTYYGHFLLWINYYYWVFHILEYLAKKETWLQKRAKLRKNTLKCDHVQECVILSDLELWMNEDH